LPIGNRKIRLPPPPESGKISRDYIFGKNIERKKSKGGNVKGKGKRKDNGTTKFKRVT
jgi:hypothetical protein